MHPDVVLDGILTICPIGFGSSTSGAPYASANGRSCDASVRPGVRHGKHEKVVDYIERAVLKALAGLLLVAWLPGAVLFRMPWLDRDRRAALDAEERLFWAVIVSVALSLAAALALAALQAYSFERLLICDAGVALAAALASRFRLRLGSAARRPSLTALIPVGLIVLGLWRFFPSSEYILGGKDPGTYVNEGVQIAQRGALVIHDPVVAAVPPFARDLFFPSHQRDDYYSVRFMGFWIQDPDAGTVVGQFPHVLPASIAIAYGLHGLTGVRWSVGVWALLGVLAFYFAGARLAGRRTAALAAVLLALHVIQTWFSHYPNAEVVMQALLFAALLANARALIDDDPFFAPIAGFLLALLLFLRFDAVLAVAGFAAAAALAPFIGKRPHPSFVVLFAAGVAVVVPYLLGPMRGYASYPFVFISNLTWPYLVALGSAGAAAAAGLVIAIRQPLARPTVVKFAPIALIAIVILSAAYALFVRQPIGRLAAHDAYALRTFTDLYLSLPALIAALIGFAIVARRRFWHDPALILTIVVFACFFFYKIRIVPEHFWMARRFLPVILPGALLFACAAATARDPGRSRTARLLRPLIGLVFVGVLGMHYSRVSAPLLAHVEYEGLIPRIEKLATLVEDDDLLIVESRDARSDVHVLATPLAYIYARNVLLLHSAKPDKPTVAAFLEWAQTRYRRVLFLGGGGTDLLSHRYGLEPLASDRFQVPEYETTTDRLPRASRRKEFDYGVYRFTPAASAHARAFDLDVGTRDDLHVVRFHAKEETGGTTFRWTGRQAFVTITVLDASVREVTVWMSNGGRPPAAPPADVEVFLHGERLGAVRVADGFRPYTLPLPADLAARASAAGDPIELRLLTRVWNPLLLLGTPDERELGVMVDRVRVR